MFLYSFIFLLFIVSLLLSCLSSLFFLTLPFLLHLNLLFLLSLSLSLSVPCVLSVEGVLYPGSATEVCAEWAQNSNTSGIFFFPYWKDFYPSPPLSLSPTLSLVLKKHSLCPPPSLRNWNTVAHTDHVGHTRTENLKETGCLSETVGVRPSNKSLRALAG